MTATLPESTVHAVRKSVGFQKNTSVLRTPIDRPEIFLGIDTFQYAQSSFQDLFFLLPLQCTTAQDVPKTVVYFDSIAELLKARTALVVEFKKRRYPKELQGCVKAYFSWLPAFDKALTSTEFMLPN